MFSWFPISTVSHQSKSFSARYVYISFVNFYQIKTL